jgi:RsiW-degrading membrane proteinase PrsW (M82 family)
MKINFTHLIAFIWACLISILWLIFMTGCSASYHYGKAVKKGMRCETISDTIEIQKIDSIFINNEWVKYVTKHDTIVRYNEVFVPKTRYQIKTEYKLKRDSIEVVRYKTKIEYKTVKKKWNFPIKILIICFAIGFVIALLKVYIKK